MASSASLSVSASASDDDERTNGLPHDPSAAAAPAAPQAHAEWAAAMQAYYAAATGSPYAWPPQQHLMAAAGAGAYGAPVPFPVYHPTYYAHATMAAGVPLMAAGEAAASAAAVSEVKSKRKSSGTPSSKDVSGSGDDGSEESSEKKDVDVNDDQKGSSSAKRKKSSNANAGVPSQVATTKNTAAESPFAAARGRSQPKLSVLAPGRAALPNDAPNLNIGTDIWSSPSAMAPSGHNEVEENAGLPSKPNSALPQMDERELKRERRKQSNRESARRSRLRKQQECEELAQKVTDLTAINNTLRSELDQLKKDCEDMETENSQLMGEMVQSEGPSVLTTLSIQIEASKAHNSGQLNKHENKG